MVVYGNNGFNGYMSYTKDNPFLRERKVLGETIKKLREDKKLTQEELADRASLNVSYLAKIENGYVNTTIRYLIKIARGLKVEVKELFEF